MSDNTELALLDSLGALRESVNDLRETQVSLKDELHAAVLDNVRRIAKVETQQTLQEHSFKSLRVEVRKDARRWGAIGGAGSSFATLLIAALKFLKHS